MALYTREEAQIQRFIYRLGIIITSAAAAALPGLVRIETARAWRLIKKSKTGLQQPEYSSRKLLNAANTSSRALFNFSRHNFIEFPRIVNCLIPFRSYFYIASGSRNANEAVIENIKTRDSLGEGREIAAGL